MQRVAIAFALLSPGCTAYAETALDGSNTGIFLNNAVRLWIGEYGSVATGTVRLSHWLRPKPPSSS